MSQITHIPATLIIPGNNDRTKFDPKAIQERAESIRENGLIQPPTVRQIEGGMFQIVAGECRVRAMKLLGWSEIPCLVSGLNDEQASVAMMIENVQRTDLDHIDEANAYANRMATYGWTIDDIAQKTGLSRNRIVSRLKLLKLRDDLRALVKSGDFKLGYAQILADANLDSNFQMLAFRKLRDHVNPTPGWFRRQVSELLEKQAQATMFDAPLFGGPALEAQPVEKPIDPPHPSNTIPPRSTLAGQVTFWQQAAGEWAKLGKSFKKQECEAAAQALQSAMMFI